MSLKVWPLRVEAPVLVRTMLSVVVPFTGTVDGVKILAMAWTELNTTCAVWGSVMLSVESVAV